MSAVVSGPDYLPRLVEGVGAAGLGFSAWAVYFYNHHLPQAFPQAARRDCFGQPCLAQLCPANPQVRAYAAALTRDMLAYGPRQVQLESIGYLPFRYGFRNPKVAVAIEPFHELLMGLCFCPHCVAAADAAGLDGARLRADVAAWLDTELRVAPGAPAATVDERASEAFDGRLARFLDVRVDRATSLFEQVAGLVRGAGARVSFYGSLDRAVTGLDRPRVLACLDAVYTTVPGEAEGAADAVRSLRHSLPGVRLVAIVRPGGFADGAYTRSLIEAQAAAGVDGFAFYTWGQLRQQQLDWIAAARGCWT